MEKLLELAKKFLEENPGINEVELTDSLNNTVHITRNAPYIAPYTVSWLTWPPAGTVLKS